MSEAALSPATSEPEVTRELVDYLRRIFPARCIKPDEDLASAHRHAGSVHVVELLENICRRQENR